MTTCAKPQPPPPKLHRGRIFRGSLVFLLLVALIVVTQLMESISVTNLIESSIYIHSTSTTINRVTDHNNKNLKQPQPPHPQGSSTIIDDLVQRRSTIQVPIENDLHYISSDNDDDHDNDDDDGENDDEELNETENIATVSTTTTTMMMIPTESFVTPTSQAPTVTTQMIPKSIRGPNHNRTLVIVLGNVRGGTPAWKSMIREVLDPNMADLALLVGEGDPVNPPERTLLHDRAKYIWTVREFEDWADAMEDIPDTPPDWRQRLFGTTNSSRRGNILLGAAHNITGSGALVFMFRFYLSQKIMEYDLLSIYNRFVVTRSDHYYLCVHNLSEFSNDYLWVPEGSDHYGICDRHFIASNETILSALDILPPLVRNPEAYKTQLQTYPYNTERFLLLRWEQEGLLPLLQRFNRTLFLVSSSKDQTRWKPKGRYIKHLDVYLKYPQEYRLSSKTCRARNIQKMQRLKARKQQQQQQQRQSK
jgi:hypothetical protein